MSNKEHEFAAILPVDLYLFCRKQGETLFYGRRSTTPSLDDGLVEARQPWKEMPRDELRASWNKRTEVKRQRVQMAHMSRSTSSCA